MTPEDDVPKAVGELIRRCLATLEHAELLLELRSLHGHARSFSAIAKSRRVEERVVASIAADLSNAMLVRIDDGLVYAPGTPELREAVEQLAQLYEERPLDLVRAIQNRPRDAIQRFADAFRIRRTD